MKLLTGKDYPHLCDGCKVTLDEIAKMYKDDLLGDTDDPEAACMYMYDHAMFCGTRGRRCKQSEEED